MYWGNKRTHIDEDKGQIVANVNALEEGVDVIDNKIYFYTDVTEESALSFNKTLHMQVQKAKMHAILNDLDPYNCGHAKIHIHSYGGFLTAGMSMSDTIFDYKKVIPITTIIDGTAASAATFISIAGTKRLMRKNATILIHQLSSGFWGKYDEIQDEMNNIDLFMNQIRNLYKEYSTVPVRELDKILKKDLYWDAEKCKKYNLIDDII